MADLCNETEGDGVTEPDYSTAPFTTRREPVQDLIQSLSHLYLENEVDAVEQEDSSQYLLLLPPPPPQVEVVITSNFESTVSKMESKMDELEKSFGVFSNGVQYDIDRQNHWLSVMEEQMQKLLAQRKDHYKRIQQLEQMLPTELKFECQQVKETLEKSIQQVGQAMMDCMA